MASQRILILAVGGLLADNIWKTIQCWSDARSTTNIDEWSPCDWPLEIRKEIDNFVETIDHSAIVPPVLYRSEHVDLWSMRDIIHSIRLNEESNSCLQLFTKNHELFTTWARSTDTTSHSPEAFTETTRLYNRFNEASSEWGNICDSRLIIIIRSVIGGLWTDEEVADSLDSIPEWWCSCKSS